MPWARKSVMEDFIQHPVERMRAGPKHGRPRTPKIRMECRTLSPGEKSTKSGRTTGACSAEKAAFTAWTFGRAQNRGRSGRERVLRQTAWTRLPSRTRWSNRGIRLGFNLRKGTIGLVETDSYGNQNANFPHEKREKVTDCSYFVRKYSPFEIRLWLLL